MEEGVSSISIEQQYALKWNDFHTKIMTTFQNLRNEFDFVDVTLACDGHAFSAHKVILSACSPYFRELLKANPCQHPIIILRDVNKANMENLLLFMYNGEVHLERDQLSDFIKAAKMLHIQGLTDIKHNFSQEIKTETQTSLTNCDDDKNNTLHSPISSQRRKSTEQINNTKKNLNNKTESQIKKNETLIQEKDSLDIKDITIEDITIDDSVNPKIELSDDDSVELVLPVSELENSSSFTKTLTGMDTNEPQSSQTQNNASQMFAPEQTISERTRLTTQSIMSSSIRSEGSHQCPVCKKNYSSPSNLRAHILNVHSNTSLNNWYQCRECGKKCKTKHYLINHEMRAHGIRQRNKRPTLFNFLNEDTM